MHSNEKYFILPDNTQDWYLLQPGCQRLLRMYTHTQLQYCHSKVYTHHMRVYTFELAFCMILLKIDILFKQACLQELKNVILYNYGSHS